MQCLRLGTRINRRFGQVDRPAIHLRGEIRQKERSDSSYIFRLGQTSQRYVLWLKDRFPYVLAFRDARLCHWCPRDRWVYGIYLDAEWPPVHCRGARERYDWIAWALRQKNEAFRLVAITLSQAASSTASSKSPPR